MTEADEQSEIVAFLSRPDSYGPSIANVECFQTHGSMVFLAGSLAFKLKRAIRYPYMDYSSVERRRAMCERELAVNRRTAPMLYLETRPILRDVDGHLRFGNASDTGDAVLDWVVVMKRFDQGALLESLRRAGALTTPMLRLAAEAVADMHRTAEVTPEYGGEAGLRRVVAENASLLAARRGQAFSGLLISDYAELSEKLLNQTAPCLEARRRDGHVRRCHGDLHLNNICVVDGRPLPFDAIEFNDNFSCIDVMYDLAFLLMDLDRWGLRKDANTVLNHYLELTGEYAGLKALPLFLSCRAGVRAHVTVAAAEAIGDGEGGTRYTEARALLSVAVGYLKLSVPRLLAVGGISGTGKSSLACELAPHIGNAPGAVIVRSDVVRKQLMGVSETTRLPADAYSPAVSKDVYRRVAEIAGVTLAAGHSVIVDAVSGAEEERSLLAGVAQRASVRFDGIWLESPEEVLRARIEGRRGDASDATVDVMQAQKRSVTKPADWLQMDATRPTSLTALAVRRALELEVY